MVAARRRRVSGRTDVDLLVAGAGPTGLALALQAHAHGARVRIVDRRPAIFRPSRALIVHPRTLEGLRPLGVTAPLLARADVAPQADLHLGRRVVRVRLGDLALADTAFPHLTFVRQLDVETILARALAERGIEVEWGTELRAVKDGLATARATLCAGMGTETIDCTFVAGCDGPESTVRRAAAIGWRGGRYAEEVVLADMELDGNLAASVAHVVIGRQGVLIFFALGEHATWRLLVTRPAGQDNLPFGEPGPGVGPAEVQALLDSTSLGRRMRRLVWSARYPLQHRLADRFRRGRLYLVGDAAHACSPATGQGMNTGIQDALNLGWKLALAARASNVTTLLDSYECERRPVARRLLALTHLAFWAEASPGLVPLLLRGVVARLGAPAVAVLVGHRQVLADLIRCVSQLRVGYPDSPLSVEASPRLRRGRRAGQWLPDATVVADGQRVHLHALLGQRSGLHVLLHRDAAPLERLALGPLVTFHRLTSTPGNGVVIIRPDGYVGFRSGIADSAHLRAWLRRIGVEGALSNGACRESG
jgi:2-polyprenyl-6-methoxyphenol hydroxylase-like FAD-dependent oxidoreductase